jgi:hypothetical protein
MIFSRFASLSGEDYGVEKHDCIYGGVKEYVNCQDSSSQYPVKYEKNERKLVGWGVNFFLVAVQRTEEVFIFFMLTPICVSFRMQ